LQLVKNEILPTYMYVVIAQNGLVCIQVAFGVLMLSALQWRHLVKNCNKSDGETFLPHPVDKKKTEIREKPKDRENVLTAKKLAEKCVTMLSRKKPVFISRNLNWS